MEKFISVRCVDSNNTIQIAVSTMVGFDETLEGLIIPVGEGEMSRLIDETQEKVTQDLKRLTTIAENLVKSTRQEQVFIDWLEAVVADERTELPKPLNKKVFKQIEGLLKVTRNPLSAMTVAVVRTSAGHTLSLKIGSYVVYTGSVEPVYKTVQPVEAASAQPEVAVPADVELVDEDLYISDSSVIVCEVLTTPEVEVAVTVSVAPVIPHWQKYSVNNGLNKW